ncbi:MAG: hypothetical protein WCT20_02670 [Candidatus Babeliales bacterium]
MLKCKNYFLAGLFTFFSVATLGYLSIATVFGPWIAPTLVLFSLALKPFFSGNSQAEKTQQILLLQSIAAVGGIVAVAIGFSLPTLFFLERPLFDAFTHNSLFFCSGLAFVCFAAGGLGLLLGNAFATSLIDREKLPFPISDLTCEMAEAEQGTAASSFLGVGFGVTFMFCCLRDRVLAASATCLNFFSAGALSPMFVALGYTTGPSIILPLLVGLCSKFLVLPVLNNHALYLPFYLFKPIDFTTFLTAFCCGLVVSEGLVGLFKLAGRGMANLQHGGNVLDRLLNTRFVVTTKIPKEGLKVFQFFLFIALSCVLLSLAKFSFVEQGVFLFLVVLATYYINAIGGKIGLIQLGRFSTYVLIPMILLFKLNPLQMTLICVFFNVCAATSSDILFDYKTAATIGVQRSSMWKLQWIGLLLTMAMIGIVFWLLFNYLPLGTASFIAQRSQSRALLINSLSFDVYVVACGFLYGLLLMVFKLSPTMIFTGLFISPYNVLALTLGGAMTYIWTRHSTTLALCAGVFSAESVWIFSIILIKWLW